LQRPGVLADQRCDSSVRCGTKGLHLRVQLPFKPLNLPPVMGKEGLKSALQRPGCNGL
jgi:hypothetical protein